MKAIETLEVEAYMVITNSKTAEFNEAVNAYIKRGYVLFGGSSHFVEGENVFLQQALVKLTPNDSDEATIT